MPLGTEWFEISKRKISSLASICSGPHLHGEFNWTLCPRAAPPLNTDWEQLCLPCPAFLPLPPELLFDLETFSHQTSATSFGLLAVFGFTSFFLSLIPGLTALNIFSLCSLMSHISLTSCTAFLTIPKFGSTQYLFSCILL